jgi:hypothetical protein
MVPLFLGSWVTPLVLSPLRARRRGNRLGPMSQMQCLQRTTWYKRKVCRIENFFISFAACPTCSRTVFSHIDILKTNNNNQQEGFVRSADKQQAAGSNKKQH